MTVVIDTRTCSSGEGQAKSMVVSVASATYRKIFYGSLTVHTGSHKSILPGPKCGDHIGCHGHGPNFPEFWVIFACFEKSSGIFSHFEFPLC